MARRRSHIGGFGAGGSRVGDVSGSVNSIVSLATLGLIGFGAWYLWKHWPDIKQGLQNVGTGEPGGQMKLSNLFKAEGTGNGQPAENQYAPQPAGNPGNNSGSKQQPSLHDTETGEPGGDDEAGAGSQKTGTDLNYIADADTLNDNFGYYEAIEDQISQGGSNTDGNGNTQANYINSVNSLLDYYTKLGPDYFNYFNQTFKQKYNKDILQDYQDTFGKAYVATLTGYKVRV
jgi:hypothetical protein